jgi:DNA repair protein RecN (Recombination protein N)
MLRLLRIRNFAIIDELELELHAGFNAITGETGAGKSILLDAISLILGNRANADLIRSGSDEATVEALFDIAKNDPFERKLQAHGIDLIKASHEIIVKRTIHRNGKNKIFLNGELITLNQLADICENLVDLCSQHEHQSLAKPAFQLDLLDRYGGLADRRREVRENHSALRSCEAELRALRGNDGEKARTEDFLRFQLNEIDEFAPRPGEEETLIAERRRLLNSTQLMEAVGQASKFLGESDDDGSDARTLIGRAAQKLAKAAQLDPSIKPAVDALERAAAELEETVSQIDSYASNLEVDPGRLEEVEERLAKWGDLKKKYGATAEEVLRSREQIAQELEGYEDSERKITELVARLESLQSDYQKSARDLSKRRKGVAKTLRDSIQNELSELMMPGTRFDIEFSEIDASADGIDRLQFLFSPNPGEGLKPVAKIASGGELSRVMLAIRRTIADRGGIGVYLFDEIDAGIGGQTASVVGKKLQTVAKYNQVICITHLPQVAAYASAHYSVSKKVATGRTLSQITLLESAKRVEELARMLGGLNVTEKSRAHAKDLIKQAAQ